MSIHFTFETFIICLETLLILTFNVLMLFVVGWTDAFKNINKYFFTSVVFSDLLIGLVITPFAIFSSLYGKWVYKDETFCNTQAYLAAMCWIVSLYSMMWINVDHYFAIRKPERHETLMSPVRSACWVALVWVAALSFCGPPLFALNERTYFVKATFLCVFASQSNTAYFVTSGLLITLPAVLTLVATNAYLFTKAYNKTKLVCEKVLVDKAMRPQNYRVNALNSLIFVVTWIPWCSVQIHQHVFPTPNLSPVMQRLHFYTLWVAIGNAWYKFIVYMIFSREFMIGLRRFFCQVLCRCACKCRLPCRQGPPPPVPV
ncbi:histamine H2 receptor-like [Liolophura sinensis]|uniref:histamine H2 receptor-like n=1 Tax=Liolophura sinensis TaxID=3198878 RepID=UPI003158136D